jgi:hypothetical protein
MKRWLIILSCLVFALILFFAVAYLRTGKPKITANYVAEYNKITKPENYDPNKNAAPYYEKAFELCAVEPNQLNKADLKAWPADLPEDKRILLQTWITDNNEAVAQLKLGAEKSYNWSEYQCRFMIGIIFPELTKARHLTYLIRAQAKLNAFNGNTQQAFSDLITAYRFGIHFQGTKTLVEQLVGIAIDAATVETAFQILNKINPDAELLKQLQQNLETLFVEQPQTIDFTSDRFFVEDMIQRMFTDNGHGSGHAYGTRFLEPKNSVEDVPEEFMPPPEQEKKLAKLGRRETLELTDKIFTYIDTIRYKSPIELHKEGKDPNKVLDNMAKDNVLLNILTPAFAKTLVMSYRFRTDTQALITTLSILRYKAERSEYPATLETLAEAGYIKEVPIDPFSGEPLVYKRTADNFVLYSVGENFVDDGGTHSGWGTNEGDYVYWPVQPVEPEKRN